MAKRPCARSGCRSLVVRGYCETCKTKYSARVLAEKTRDSAAKRGYGYRWQQTSKGRLIKHPLCEAEWCPNAKIVHAASCTDHIIPHKGDMTLFWDPSNWQSLCDTAHGVKTAREDGGFGRSPIKSCD